MAEPVLSSLCSICHINKPRYRCPRCSTRTCSLPCITRHKSWASCNGQRDPTVFKPKRELATPAGIDHDYNFISAIERRIGRSESEIVDERGLVSRKELQDGVGQHRGRWRPRVQTRGDEPLLRALEQQRISVLRAPKGMQRNKENTTTWNKKQKCINWHVEWRIHTCDSHQVMASKVLDKKPVGTALYDAVDEDRRARMNDGERKLERKRRADESLAARERAAKRVCLQDGCQHRILDFTARKSMQDATTSAWVGAVTTTGDAGRGSMENLWTGGDYVELDGRKLWLYLHRPRTLSSKPPVLVPISPALGLSRVLEGREVLEFPTIYALPYHTPDLPSTQFLLEAAYDRIRAGGAVSDDSDSESDSDSQEASSESSGDDIEESSGDGELIDAALE